MRGHTCATIASAYATTSPGSGFSATSIDRREQEAGDVEIAIMDTVAAQHDWNPCLATLQLDGGLVQLGLPSGEMPPVKPSLLIGRRLSHSGSLIGGIRETQEMLDFCAENAVTSEIEMVKADQLDEAYDRMVAGDVRYRFVLDNSSLDGIVASGNHDAEGTEGITL